MFMLYPVFVYGTLRKGFGNYAWALGGQTEQEAPATLYGFDMYAVSSFPGIVEGAGHVVGELMYLKDAATLTRLDRLEGYEPGRESHSMYLRIRVACDTADGPIDAWTYVWNRALRDTPRIESGDFADYRQYEKTRR